MLKNGDVREDGFTWVSGVWRSPKGVSRLRAVAAGMPGTPSNLGQAAEHLVASDLLSRQLRVTKPLNVNGAHDLHAYMAGEWRTIQVKSARRRPTGLLANTFVGVTSDILALVWLPTKEIRYIAKNIPSLPAELETFLDDFLKGLDK